MTAAFWILVGLIAYAYIGYPAVIVAISSLSSRKWKVDERHEPALSLLIPAYNEEKVIEQKIQNALSLDYPPGKLEIVVASESDDGTDRIVTGYADRGVRLLPSASRLGKSANLARAVPETRGDILVFTDANAIFRRDALRKLARRFADPRVGSVSGRLVYRSRYGTAAEYGEEVYWDIEWIVKRASARLGLLPAANGSIYALRRELYRPISARRGDDFELPIRVILQGYDSILEPEAVSEEATAGTFLAEYRRKVRIVNTMVVSALILVKEAIASGRWFLAAQLLSHKVNRWAVPIWLIPLLPISLTLAPQGAIYALALAGQGGLYALALAGFLLDRARLPLPRPLALPLYFVMVNTASLVGIVTAAAGREVRWHKRADGLD